MKICRKCGKIYKGDDGFDFCPKDGNKLSVMINADLLSLLEDRSRSIDGVWQVFGSVSGADDEVIGIFSGNALDVAYFVKNNVDMGDSVIQLKPLVIKEIGNQIKKSTVRIKVHLNYNNLKSFVDFDLTRSNKESIYSLLFEGSRMNFHLDANDTLIFSPRD